MAHGRLRSIVWRLRLRHVDNGAGHATDEDDAARGLALHEVLCDARGEEVGTVDVDAPQLLHPVVGVVYGIVVFGEAGRGDEGVYFAVLFYDIFYAVGD
jgi:hypothetical protein